MLDPAQLNAAAPAAIGGLSWLRVILAFIIVGGLLAGLGFGLNYLNLRGVRMPGLLASGKSRRLRLIETLPIDARRRLVLVRCDGAEHLLLLGPTQDVVVQTGIASPAASAAP